MHACHRLSHLFELPFRKENVLVGSWKLTEELIDIGDGKGTFRTTERTATIEFSPDGTFSATETFCRVALHEGAKGSGRYSVTENKLMPDNCQDENRTLTFEQQGDELIVNLICIEPCKQKYVRVE